MYLTRLSGWFNRLHMDEERLIEKLRLIEELFAGAAGLTGTEASVTLR